MGDEVVATFLVTNDTEYPILVSEYWPDQDGKSEQRGDAMEPGERRSFDIYQIGDRMMIETTDHPWYGLYKHKCLEAGQFECRFSQHLLDKIQLQIRKAELRWLAKTWCSSEEDSGTGLGDAESPEAFEKIVEAAANDLSPQLYEQAQIEALDEQLGVLCALWCNRKDTTKKDDNFGALEGVKSIRAVRGVLAKCIFNHPDNGGHDALSAKAKALVDQFNFISGFWRMETEDLKADPVGYALYELDKGDEQAFLKWSALLVGEEYEPNVAFDADWNPQLDIFLKQKLLRIMAEIWWNDEGNDTITEFDDAGKQAGNQAVWDASDQGPEAVLAALMETFANHWESSWSTTIGESDKED